MSPFLDRFDHVHIHVTDRPAAEQWYREVLGLQRRKELESWAVPHGPLMLENESGSLMLALFEKPREPNRSIIAFGVPGTAFVEWMASLSGTLGQPVKPVDHGLAWSLYFADPDGNPFEITTYDYALVAGRLSAR